MVVLPRAFVLDLTVTVRVRVLANGEGFVNSKIKIKEVKRVNIYGILKEKKR